MGKLLVRITEHDGSKPIVIERAEDISEFEAVNSSDEGGSFAMPANDPKLKYIDYTKWWEIWDADKNERLNRGPIHEIVEGNEQWRVSGPGRSQILEDLIMTKHTWYYPINRFIDDLRYENVATEPRTVVKVYGEPSQPNESNPKYLGLSKKTKNNAIDDTVVFTVSDKRIPTFHTTDSFWAGTGRSDGITVNLGQKVNVSKVSLLFPWWGGYKRFTDRAYDFSLKYGDGDNFTNIVTKDPNYIVTADKYGGFFFYFHPSGYLDNYGFEPLAERIQDDPIDARYWRVDINDTHAWYGNILTGAVPEDRWTDQCTPPPVGSGHEPGSINSKSLEPSNDCFASMVEVGIYEEILGRDQISNLAYQEIDNTSNQITYTHTVGNEENGQQVKVSVLDAYTLTRYEPGNFFKKVRFSWTGAGSAFTKFYPDDPEKSMTSSVVAVVDQNNSLVYRTTLTSGTKDLILPAYTQFIQIKGAIGVEILTTDAWIGEANAFSVGNSISTSVHANDKATLHFRGRSLKMFVTTPAGKQGGTVRLQIRTKNPTTGAWGGFTTLADNVQIPNAVENYKLFEIKPDSGMLVDDGIYEFRVTNLGGYVGLDAFAGYWQASWIDFNEDHERVLYNDNASAWTQIYDGRFSAGSMMKTNEFGAHMQFGFEGDRVQLFMAKGPNFGKATIYISGPGSYGTNLVTIPTIGDSLVVDCGKESGSDLNHYIPRYLVFDSNDYWPNGMPWQPNYNLHVRLLETETYTTKKNQANDSLFDQPCIDCNQIKDVKINKFIYIDGVSAHCTSGLSAKFNNETHLSILKSLSEIIQHEWRITEAGLFVRPRIGVDTDFIIREGEQAVITHDITNDASKIATLLYSNGADIDGLPLFTISEDKTTKKIMHRTIARTNDFRSVGDYFTLIGASRGELLKRRTPEERITLTYVGNLPIELGDSFTLVTKKVLAGRKVRLMKLTQNQSSGSGYSYALECVKWPQTPDSL